MRSDLFSKKSLALVFLLTTLFTISGSINVSAASDEDRLKSFAQDVQDINDEPLRESELSEEERVDSRMESFASQVSEINEQYKGSEIKDDVIIKITKKAPEVKTEASLNITADNNAALLPDIRSRAFINSRTYLMASELYGEFPTGDWTRYGTKLVDLGDFKLTAYDACILCCGKTDGITATNTKCFPGRTIAVDPTVIPYGSKVLIGGYVFVAEDCGGKVKGNHIDLYMETHEIARQFGLRHGNVMLITN